MGTRPNLVPPTIVSTSAIVIETENEQVGSVEDEETAESDAPIADTSEVPSEIKDNATILSVRKSLEVKKTQDRDTLHSKSALGVFAKIMGDKVEETSKLEREKMKIQQENFWRQQDIDKERNEIERLKVD